jgi:hypothetical protein
MGSTHPDSGTAITANEQPVFRKKLRPAMEPSLKLYPSVVKRRSKGYAVFRYSAALSEQVYRKLLGRLKEDVEYEDGKPRDISSLASIRWDLGSGNWKGDIPGAHLSNVLYLWIQFIPRRNLMIL